MNIQINNNERGDFFLSQTIKDLNNSYEFIGTTYEINSFIVLQQHKKIYGA